MTPRKTYNVCISEKIPETMLKHFIRGFFDGDGCITDTQGYPHITFSSGSEQFLKQLTKIFLKLGVKLQSKNDIPLIYNNNQISYFCSNAMKILKWLYEDSTPLTRLDRKYDKYLTYLNKKYDNIDYKQEEIIYENK